MTGNEPPSQKSFCTSTMSSALGAGPGRMWLVVTLRDYVATVPPSRFCMAGSNPGTFQPTWHVSNQKGEHAHRVDRRGYLAHHRRSGSRSARLLQLQQLKLLPPEH